MKDILSLFIILLATATVTQAQQPYMEYSKTSKVNQRSYKQVYNDPANSRWYTLKNGLTVIIAENHLEPKVMSLFVTKAGSKHDPSTNTGLAHYLEHMLFKGTDQFGTKDYAKEQVELQKIEDLYERYNKTTDQVLRKTIYHQIDSISGVAAKYAIANEYDKLMSNIGSNMTNAFTSFENTTYMENFPSNNLEKYLKIQAERFRNPVMRLFHTELEAVYEEKNMSLDDDDNKIFEAMFGSIFSQHPYGTQTTIGTIEHLKNPSLVEIRKYFNKYYVPENMALILSGDLNPDETIELVDKYLGSWTGQPIKQPYFKPQDMRDQKEEITILGPSEEKVAIGFLMPGTNDKDAVTADLVSSILYNGKSGLIDKNLVLNQDVLEGYAFTYLLKDNGIIWFQARPKVGQTLDQAKDLLLDQIKKLKAGQFDESLITGTVNNIKIDRIRQMESATQTAFILHSCFVEGKPWATYLNNLQEMSKITKTDVMNFAEKWFKDNYTVVYKKTGADPNTQKVEKPQITPVEVNRDDHSQFIEEIAQLPVKEIQPVFLNYDTDIQKSEINKQVPIYYVANKLNPLFSLYYRVDFGQKHDQRIDLALEYLSFLGTSTRSNSQINAELYNLGLNWHASATTEYVQIGLNGLEENFDKGIALLEDLINNAKPDEAALKNLIANKIKARQDNLLNRDEMFYNGLMSYLKYDATNPYNSGLSNETLKKITSKELIDLIKNLSKQSQRVLYYGARPLDALSKTLKTVHKTNPSGIKPEAKYVYNEVESNDNQVFFVDYDMVQAQIFFNKKADMYQPSQELPAKMYNEYYGGSMASVVFQDIRESKALAYSAYSSFKIPENKSKPYMASFFVGTQADKLPDAMSAISNLLENMPESEQLWNISKNAFTNAIASQRINKENILFSYETAKAKGLDYDIRKEQYEKASEFTFDDLKKFHDKEFKNQQWRIGIMGSKERINMTDLSKYGKVKQLTLRDLYGYDESDFQKP